MDITLATRDKLGLQYLLDDMAPCSPYGAERVRRLRFFMPEERAALEAEWANVAAALAGMEREPARYDPICHLMMQTRDIRGTLRRCEETVLTEVELFEVKRFLLQMSRLVALFAPIAGQYRGITFTEERTALDLLDPEGKRSAAFAIGDRATPALYEARTEKRAIELALRETPQGGKRDDLLNRRQLAVSREQAEALRVRTGLTEALRPHAPALLRNTEMVGALDFAIQKAQLARRHGMVRPAIAGEADGLRLDGVTNPSVSDSLAGRGRAFTPVTIDAPQGVTVITGANMGGKSVALRTLALNVLLSQCGFFACADAASLPLFDAVCLIGEEGTDARAGLSSFGAEVLQIQQALEAVAAGQRCFIAMDEPARGTNPREGAALVRALVNRLARARAVTVIATHYDGVSGGAAARYQAAGLKSLPARLPEGDRLAFIAAHMDYGLTRVDSDAGVPAEALAVCRLLGLDGVVVDDMARTLGDHGEENI